MVKFGYSEKATKFEKILSGNFLKILWPSQNIRTFYHSEPSPVPYSTNQFLGWDFFMLLLCVMESLGLKSPGLKVGVEMSCNLHLIDLAFHPDLKMALNLFDLLYLKR